MASKFAESVFEKHLAQPFGKGGWLTIIDAELSDVREVVELAAHPKFTTVDGRVVYYLTKSDVEAARALYEKLVDK